MFPVLKYKEYFHLFKNLMINKPFKRNMVESTQINPQKIPKI